MKTWVNSRKCLAVFVVLIGWVSSVPEALAQQKRNEVEAGANYRYLTDDFPSWEGAYVRFVLKTPSGRDTWYLETVGQKEFGDYGTYVSAANSHTINDDWYSFVAVGGGAGGFFFPDVRVDAQLNRKWLPARRLVTTFGVGYYNSKTSHYDTSLLAGGVYYINPAWVLQGGVRWNRSMPGEIVSRSQFLAITQGHEGDHFLVLRGEVGREAYQALGPQTTVVDFPSRSVSVTWKQWMGDTWGFNSVGEYYRSDIYKRMGASFGIFKAF